jgi:hypothetical protein
MIRKILLSGVALYSLFVGGVYWQMTRPPMEFAGVMAKLPGPAMMLFPFEPMWSRARSGALSIGSMAPDFELATVDKKSKVRLSSFRGARPVALVFGSYT